MLLFGGLLVGVGGRVGVVHTLDGSVRGVASGAVWVVLLPAVVALVVSRFSAVTSAAVSAGAGLMGLSRVLSDVTLLRTPNTAVRPEMFYEVSNLAQPFTRAGGAWLVLAGDLFTVLAGILAGRQLIATVSFAPVSFAPVSIAPVSIAPIRPEESFDADPSGRPDPGDRRPARDNDPMVAVGFLGVVALLIASLGLPYRGGYLAGRYLPAELDLWGIGGALTVAVLAGAAVLTAAMLPRPTASAMLGGVALGAAVPFLTAVAVRVAGAPVQLNPTVGLGLAGAVLLASAGLPVRARRPGAAGDQPSDTSVRTLTVVAAALSLLVAVAAAAAWRLPQLRYDGGADPVLPDGFAASAPLTLPLLISAVMPLIGAVLTLVAPLARAGRAVVGLAWIPLVYGVAQSLDLLGRLVASASVPNAAFAAPVWSAGPGLWCGVAGTVIGLAALVVSTAAAGAARNASSMVPEDDTLTPVRCFGQRVAAGLTAVALAASALPVYRSAAGSSATLLIGFGTDSGGVNSAGVDFWGVFALAVGMVAAAWAAGRAYWPSQAIAFALTGAAMAAVRLAIPPAVRARDGFVVGPGLYAGYVAAFAFVAAAAALAVSGRRIRMTDLAAAGRFASSSRGKKGRR